MIKINKQTNKKQTNKTKQNQKKHPKKPKETDWYGNILIDWC
jgi:hypothetical protein